MPDHPLGREHHHTPAVFPGSVAASQDLTDGYHLYTAVWDDNYLKFYVDNDATPYFTAAIKKGFSRSAYFHKPYFIILDLAVGGDFTGITSPAGVTALPNDGSEAQMLVDYIRVYQQKDQENVTTASDIFQQKTAIPTMAGITSWASVSATMSADCSSIMERK